MGLPRKSLVLGVTLIELAASRVVPAPPTFGSTLGVVSPLDSRSVVLTPRGEYDIAIPINSPGRTTC